MIQSDSKDAWPELSHATLKPTLEALQLWTQVVGKVRLAKTPWVNHSWHTTLYVSARGLTTSLIPNGALGFELEFDLVSHALVIRVSDGRERRIAFAPGNVAGFYGEVLDALSALGVSVEINETPNELPEPTPFSQDTTPRAYDADAAHCFWRVLVQSCNATVYSSSSGPVLLASAAPCISSGAASISR